MGLSAKGLSSANAFLRLILCLWFYSWNSANLFKNKLTVAMTWNQLDRMLSKITQLENDDASESRVYYRGS